MDVKTERESDMKDQLNVGGGVTYYDFFFTKDGKPTLRRRVSAPYNLGE
jgi:hypothetical protein